MEGNRELLERYRQTGSPGFSPQASWIGVWTGDIGCWSLKMAFHDWPSSLEVDVLKRAGQAPCMQAMLVDLTLADFGNARCSLVWGAFMKPALCFVFLWRVHLHTRFPSDPEYC